MTWQAMSAWPKSPAGDDEDGEALVWCEVGGRMVGNCWAGDWYAVVPDEFNEQTGTFTTMIFPSAWIPLVDEPDETAAAQFVRECDAWIAEQEIRDVETERQAELARSAA